jgi:hypothetical protein
MQVVVHRSMYACGDAGGSPLCQNGSTVKLTTCLHLVPRLRTYGGLDLPLYVFMTWYLIIRYFYPYRNSAVFCRVGYYSNYEDGGSRYRRNVGSSLSDCVASHTRRQCSS